MGYNLDLDMDAPFQQQSRMLRKEVKMFKVKKPFLNADIDAQAGGAEPEKKEAEQPEMVPMSEFKKLQESIAKLEKHNEAVIGEKRKAEAAARQAKEEAEQQELEASKKAQNFEDFEQRNNALWQGKMDAKEERISLLELQLEGQAKRAAESGLLSKFADEGTGSLALKEMVRVTLDDDLQPVTEYCNLSGEVITTDKAAFVEYLNTNHATWMRGAESSKTVVDSKVVDVTPALKGIHAERANSINQMVDAVPALKDLPVR